MIAKVRKNNVIIISKANIVIGLDGQPRILYYSDIFCGNFEISENLSKDCVASKISFSNITLLFSEYVCFNSTATDFTSPEVPLIGNCI